MKHFARLQSKISLPEVRSCLRARKFATHSPAQSEAAGLNKPEQDDFLFDDLFEVDADEKTIDTAAGSLPISPLLDPKWREARARGKQKPLPDMSKLNRFQRKLYQNPFAQMLAKPVRSCYVTRTRLPGAFLQNFGLIRHPETNDIWWVPDTVTQSKKSVPEKSAEAPGSQPESSSDETAGTSGTTYAAAEPEEARSTEPKSHYRYSSHVLARQDLLKSFVIPGSKYKGGNFRLASSPHVSGQANSAIWREDMDSVIIELSRHQIMHDLIYLSKLCEEQDRKYLIRTNDAKETGHFVRRWAFLWLEGQGDSSDVKVQESTSGFEKFADGPEQYATLDIDGAPDTTIPLYNLPRLLGPDNLLRLRSISSILRHGELFLLRGQRSSELNLKLWRLQGYMADYNKLK
ncbi:hypothetical protein VP1G_10196 [Cytospora mali]|uniref:Uncharacterized protein n=1 Tax=Cytospora mali TaxID=578113 RepID=A0A194VH16_CYTMA|nr:hypothetical protein VP1G_10196 [Valsa mali var. pyri (nom. inval.)]